MSFHGGTGHKSPFAERAKATKSHLSPRRCSTAAGAGNVRPAAQQSLFGGQLRSTQSQSEVKEPTTPTKASEGSATKGTRRDEFSSFNGRRVGTPIKTPRTAFGSIPPRSPKRPYVGSPKYQKVLLERPAFYNSPATVVSTTDSGRKEVSISELQKRLKRFLQDENIPAHIPLEVTRAEHFDEVPFNISRSPRVNPLFYHDNSVIQVAKGGVAFTAGENPSTHSPSPSVHSPVFESLKETDESSSGMHFTRGGVAFTAGVTVDTCMHTPVALFNDERVQENKGEKEGDLGRAEVAASCEADSLPECPPEEECSCADESINPPESTESAKDLSTEDFPVYSETDVGNQVEESGQEDVFQGHHESVETVALEVSHPNPEKCIEVEQQCDASANVIMFDGLDSKPLEEAVEVTTTIEDAKEIVESTPLIQEATCGSKPPVAASEHKSPVAAMVHHYSAKVEFIYDEEEEAQAVASESWYERLIRFVVLAVMVTCVMGFMALVSGSQGLIPEAFRVKSAVTPFSNSPVRTSIIPVSIGFLGMGKDHEKIPCDPGVHFGLKFLSISFKPDVIQPEGHAFRHTSFGYDSAQDAELPVHDVEDLDQLKSVTEHYKELQGKLLLDVASLTSESAPSGTSDIVIKDGRTFHDTEGVAEPEDNEVILELMPSEGATDLVTAESLSELNVQPDDPESAEDVVEERGLEAVPLSDELGSGLADYSLTSENLESSRSILATNLEVEALQLESNAELDVLVDAQNVLPSDDTDSADSTEQVCDVSMEPVELDSNLEEVTPSVEKISTLEVSGTYTSPVIVEDLVPHVLEDISTDQLSVESPWQGTEDVVSMGYPAEEHGVVKDSEDIESFVDEGPTLSQSLMEEVHSSIGPTQSSEAVCDAPGSTTIVPEVDIHEEADLHTTTIGFLVAALAFTMLFAIKSRKSPPATGVTPVTQAEAFTAIAADKKLFPSTTSAFKPESKPVTRPTRSVYDSYIPASEELDAITSPLKSIRTPRYIGMEGFSAKYGAAQPATSSPNFYQPSAKVDKLQQKPTTTWHPAMNSGNMMSSSYRQTASYVPTLPSESGISTSTRGESEMNSVAESALSMGAEEWEHLGSYTTTELISLNDGREELKKRTPVRRSQRIRNKVSPLPVRFT